MARKPSQPDLTAELAALVDFPQLEREAAAKLQGIQRLMLRAGLTPTIRISGTEADSNGFAAPRGRVGRPKGSGKAGAKGGGRRGGRRTRDTSRKPKAIAAIWDILSTNEPTNPATIIAHPSMQELVTGINNASVFVNQCLAAMVKDGTAVKGEGRGEYLRGDKPTNRDGGESVSMGQTTKKKGRKKSKAAK
jgi:hypothetical protein